MSEYFDECDENWIVAYANLKAAERSQDEYAIQRWNEELTRIRQIMREHLKEQGTQI